MQRKRDSLVPIAEALADLPGPVQARHHFTQADQVHQLVSASEADPDPGLHGADDGALLAAPHQPRQPYSVQAKRVNGPYKLIMSVSGDHKLPFGNRLDRMVRLRLRAPAPEGLVFGRFNPKSQAS